MWRKVLWEAFLYRGGRALEERVKDVESRLSYRQVERCRAYIRARELRQYWKLKLHSGAAPRRDAETIDYILRA